MKLLLFPILAALTLPTAVNAFPWNKDIVVKTNVGEKYIVKDSTVMTIYTDKTSLIKKIKKSIDTNQQNFEKCASSILGKRRCKKIYEPEKSQAKYSGYIKNIEENFPDKNLYANIYFTPIFQNLNGNKMPTEEMDAYCIDKNLKNENQVLINTWQYSSDSDGLKPDNLKSYGRYVKDQLKIDVCEKYAKF